MLLEKAEIEANFITNHIENMFKATLKHSNLYSPRGIFLPKDKKNHKEILNCIQ